MKYRPPYSTTPTIIRLVGEIGEALGRHAASVPGARAPHLGRGNRIRTVQASLAIENNTLSLEQVTAILDGKRVLGAPVCRAQTVLGVPRIAPHGGVEGGGQPKHPSRNNFLFLMIGTIIWVFVRGILSTPAELARPQLL